MGKLMENWKRMTKKEQICNGIGLTCNFSVILLVLLQLFHLWEDAVYAYMPLMCISMTTQAIRLGRRSGVPFWVSVAAAAVIAVCLVSLLLL